MEIIKKNATYLSRNLLVIPARRRAHPEQFAFDELHAFLQAPQQVVGIGIAGLGVELRDVGDDLLLGGVHNSLVIAANIAILTEKDKCKAKT